MAQRRNRHGHELRVADGQQPGCDAAVLPAIADLGTEHLRDLVVIPAGIVAGGLPQRALEALPPDHRVAGRGLALHRQVEHVKAVRRPGMHR